MDRALGAGESKESTELDKNIALHLKFFRKIHICEVAVLNFTTFSEKTEKHVPRIPFNLSIRFLHFADRRNTRKQDPFEKKSIWVVSGGKFACPKVESGKIDI